MCGPHRSAGNTHDSHMHTLVLGRAQLCHEDLASLPSPPSTVSLPPSEVGELVGLQCCPHALQIHTEPTILNPSCSLLLKKNGAREVTVSAL